MKREWRPATKPGQYRWSERVRKVALAAKERGIPIRIGVNAGSLEKDIRDQYGGISAAAMVISALKQAALLEEVGHSAIILSLKASNVLSHCGCLSAGSREMRLSLHLGITEAGTVWRGSIRSAGGLGVLLYHGIGDTIRVSLTGIQSKR